MQRCPYLHEMKERLLGPTPVRQETLTMDSFERENENLLSPSSRPGSNQVGTVVKLNSDGYGAHTSPTHHRTPLVPRDLGENFNLGNDEDDEIQLDPRKPKNANNPYDDYRVYCQENKNKLRTSLFIVTSLVYAMLLIVVCVAYVISDVTTHRLPIMYYEGFFTYLYGASILFLLYVFCFLLQESTCCQGSSKPKPPKQKKPKKEKPKKEDKNAKGDAKDGKGGKDGKDAGKPAKPSPYQEVFPKKKRDVVRESLLNKESAPEAEVATSPPARRRKTTHDAHGSFFLRVGAIAFGLGTMIYTGLEIGSFFEIPFDSPCHQILRGVNPLLQMIFTFMQMYFVFMNSRLNIHRFKVLARFGLMHIVATNICVWIRTLVLESLKEITAYHQRRGLAPEDNAILETIRQHTLKNAGLVLGTDLGPRPDTEWEPVSVSRNIQEVSSEEVPVNVLSRVVKSTVETLVKNSHEKLQNAPVAFATFTTTTQRTVPTTVSSTTEALTTPTTEHYSNFWKKLVSTVASTVTSTATTTTVTTESPFYDQSGEDLATTTTRSYPRNWVEDVVPAMYAKSTETPSTSTATSFFNDMVGQMGTYDYQRNGTNNLDQAFEKLEELFPQALTQLSTIGPNATSCGRVNIMGTIVQDSAPYLYPFIVEYSLIGAVVIYVMWRHIGRYPKFASAEDLEHRLEVMLSRRAVAMAQAHSGKVDCVGASKGLFFGLLLLVGSLICLILFFVLVRHPQLSLLAIYLADASHAILMGFAIFAIIIGFIRVQNLKFRCEEQSNLNDILLRISAFGLFIYSTFSVIAGALNALESEPNLLVTVTGAVAILQVVFQLLFIADVSRRRVHLPEHDRSKPGRQVVTFLLICNVSMFAIYTFEAQKVFANPVQLDFYGFIAWSIIQRVTLPLCIFHRFHSAVTLAEIWKTTYKARLE